METAVVYYSLQGNCRLAAKALSEKLGARLVELKECKPRPTDSSVFMKAGLQAMFGVRSKLVGAPWQEAANCGVLHLITPIWASRQAPAMNRLLSSCDFTGKTVTLYTVQADTAANADKARQAMANVVRRKGGTVKAVHGLVGAGPGKGVREELAREICALGE